MKARARESAKGCGRGRARVRRGWKAEFQGGPRNMIVTVAVTLLAVRDFA